MDKIQNITVERSEILIVDDNSKNLQVLGKLLKENNYSIEFAIDGEAALKWIEKKSFDLILLDINMPGLSGFEVCTRMRQHPGSENTPIIFLTADTERDSVLKGFELGAQDYITKPFDSRELLVRVKTHLSLKYSLEKLSTINNQLEGIVHDRTMQLEKAIEDLHYSNQELLKLDTAKTTFLQLISHEIRTPLNGIVGPLDLLKRQYKIHELDKLVGVLEHSVERLERFSLDAILITNLMSSPEKVRKSAIYIIDFIESELQKKLDFIESRNLKVVKEYDDDNSIVQGDPDLVRKCLGNLIDNAYKFSPDGGTIGISSKNSNSEFIIEITNQGHLSESIEQKAFDLFTTGGYRNDAQLGIGLSIVKLIMQAHEGNVEIHNTENNEVLVRLTFKNNG